MIFFIDGDLVLAVKRKLIELDTRTWPATRRISFPLHRSVFNLKLQRSTFNACFNALLNISTTPKSSPSILVWMGFSTPPGTLSFDDLCPSLVVWRSFDTINPYTFTTMCSTCDDDGQPFERQEWCMIPWSLVSARAIARLISSSHSFRMQLGICHRASTDWSFKSLAWVGHSHSSSNTDVLDSLTCKYACLCYAL